MTLAFTAGHKHRIISDCCGADKRVDSANNLSVKCVQVCMAKDNGGR